MSHGSFYFRLFLFKALSHSRKADRCRTADSRRRVPPATAATMQVARNRSRTTRLLPHPTTSCSWTPMLPYRTAMARQVVKRTTPRQTPMRCGRRGPRARGW